jgi:hypothetical protein
LERPVAGAAKQAYLDVQGVDRHEVDLADAVHVAGEYVR